MRDLDTQRRRPLRSALPILSLAVLVGLTSVSAQGDAGDAKVAGTGFHATGEMPCAESASQPMRACRFGVIRRGNGDATVTVFWPAGGERTLRFAAGKATSSDGAGAVTTEKVGDLNKVFVGTSERFEIPDVAVLGD